MTKTHEELLREAFERDYDKWSMVDVDLRWNDSARCYVNQSTHIAFGGYQAALQTANAAGESPAPVALIEKVAEAIYNKQPELYRDRGTSVPESPSYKPLSFSECCDELRVLNLSRAQAAITAIPSLSFDEAVVWMTDNKDFWNAAGYSEHPKKVAMRILKALTANGDVLIRRSE